MSPTSAPLTSATQRCIDSRRIAALAPGAVIVNVARGGRLDLDAATEPLRSGQLFPVIPDQALNLVTRVSSADVAADVPALRRVPPSHVA